MKAGYSKDSVVVLASAAPPAETAEGEAAPAAADTGIDMETAVRAGRMLGDQADFYLSRLEGGNALVVATPSFLESRRAEEILNEHKPLPISHRPEPEPFIPFSEQATPFSNLFGMPVLTKSATPFSDALGFGFKEEGLSQLSRFWPPLAPGYTFSSKIGMGFKAKKDTFFGASTKSDRLEGKSSSFGMGFKADRETPFSAMLGLPLLTKRKHFLTS
ncbi:MAG: hypothetical protein V2I82_03805 [Halieaceae bacterium]|nr:hypothetical protein [Halieaceae bacterium]